MSIRISKAVKDLNVGAKTLVEFLQKKGIEVENNPNAKISDEDYSLLVKEFSKDKNLKIESDRISQERHKKDKNKESVAIEGYKDKAEKKNEEIKLEVERPQIKVTGHVDLEALNRRKSAPQNQDQKNKRNSENNRSSERPAFENNRKETNVSQPNNRPEKKEVPVQKSEPIVNKEQNPKIEEKKTDTMSESKVTNTSKEEVKNQEAESASSNEVFRLNKPQVIPSIKVMGTIDLNSLNQQTRPKKKTKEEKKKEREMKEGPKNRDQKKPGQFNNSDRKGPHPNGNNNQNQSANANDDKKKRNRINKQKVDVAAQGQQIARNQNNQSQGNNQNNNNNNNRNNNNNNFRNNNRPLKKPVPKQEVSEEDVQKQIKETLARLTAKTSSMKKGTKYRKEKREQAAGRMAAELEAEQAESKLLKLTEFVTANDLASMMNVNVNQVIATCMSIGMMVSINQRLDAETINIVAEEFGYKTEYVSAEVVDAITEEADSEEDLMSRPPIVTVMGHVDHGKTSLLDYVRKANVIAGEAGGITQHIGAYNVKLNDGRQVTFLDTPGHEAFTAMRARGAQVTDIAIIIVAADDSVMPQTIEAINHAAAAGVPIVFAINKIDKPNANPEKIKEALAQMNYLVEDWGGKYQSQEISAKQGLGVEELLDKVLLEAEILELKANPDKRAVGSVIESTLDKGRGYVATVLVQSGTLKIGDVVIAGTHFGRVKAMFNERNQKVTEAGPAVPVQILGFNGAPQAGDKFNVLETEQEAREIANKREQLAREQGLRTQKMLTLDDIGRRIAVGNFQELNVIVKGDVDGSVEALSDSLIKLSTPEIQVNVIHKAVGQISESDVTLAAASNAIIIGFQVRPSLAARRLAEKDGVEIRLYSIIYDAIEEVKDAMEGMLAPEIKEEIVAYLEVRETFKITKVGTVAGCIVKEGKIKRNNKIRLIRDGIVIYAGDLG